ncbi:MAG: hypothetical protein ABIG90_01270 [bacterium]
MALKIIKLILILGVSAAAGFLSAKYFLVLSKEQPVILNKTEKIIISEEKGIVEVIKKIQPSILEQGLAVTSDGFVASLDGLKKIEQNNLPIVDLADWEKLNLGQRVVLIGENRVEAGIISQIKKDLIITNIVAYTDVNGLPVANLEAKVIGLAKVIQGRVNIVPIKLTFEDF